MDSQVSIRTSWQVKHTCQIKLFTPRMCALMAHGKTKNNVHRKSHSVKSIFLLLAASIFCVHYLAGVLHLTRDNGQKKKFIFIVSIR